MAMEALRSLWLSSCAPAVELRAEARTQPNVSAPERSVDWNILLLLIPAMRCGRCGSIARFLDKGRPRGQGHMPVNFRSSPNAFGGTGFAERRLWNIGPSLPESVRPDARELHHLSPFLNVLGYELAELVGRTCKRRVAKIFNPHLHRGIGENSIDLLIELLDGIGGRILRRAD